MGNIVWQGMKQEGVDPSFYYVIGGITILLFILFLYFAVGRVRLKVVGDKLYIAKTVFGIGIGRKFSLLNIQRLRMLNRGGTRGWGWGFFAARVTDQVCEIETDQEIRIFGSHLKAEHLHYMRYLIVQRIQEVRARPGGRAT